MFKKKPAPEQPRGRNRASQPLPRNTAVFSYHANRSTSLESRERVMQEPEPRPKAVSRFGLRRIGSKHVLSVIIIIIFFLLSVGLDTRPKIVVLGDRKSVV